jgi:hypothetical protein
VPALRPLTSGMRGLLYTASVLVLLAAGELYILTGHTDRFFAWTIHPGQTAAFLGAGYLAAFFLEFLSARQRIWANARLAVPAVLVFTVLTLVATLLHLGKFHFGSPHPVASFSAWAWLAIYTVVPILMIILLVREAREAGGDPPRRAPMPRWVLVVVGVQGGVLLAMGAALFVAPAHTSYWPWPLTPLTAQAVGAWLLGIGTGAIHAIRENDFRRLRAGAVALTLLGVFQLIALARYPHDVDWARPAAWIYLTFVLSLLTVGVPGWFVGYRRPVFQAQR